MKDIFKLLKVGVTKSDYPIFGQYVNSTGKQLQTYNKSALVCVDYELPFKGSTSFFILENLLSNINDPIIKQKDNIIYIEAENLKSKLIIDDVGFPIVPKYNYNDGLVIDDELLYMLNFATKFVNKEGILNYVVLTDRGIIATDRKRLFCFNNSYNIKNNIFVNKRIINSLQENYEINFDDNVYVKFNNGYMIFEVDTIVDYPIDKLYNIILESSNNITKLCSMSYIKDAIQKVSSILFNESFKYITLFNKNNKLTVHAESSDGEASVEYESSLKGKFEIQLDINYLNDIGIDYDIYTTGNKSIYLKNNNCEIVIAACA